MTTFLTSDQHFCHANIIKYCHRPFSSVGEMDEAMIAAWNAVVTDKDTVYQLGDFCLGGPDAMVEIGHKLNGTVHVIPGCHDSLWIRGVLSARTLPWYNIVLENKIIVLPLPEYSLDGGAHPLYVTLCHYPMSAWYASYHGSVHFHGHSHTVNHRLDVGRRFDVGVDGTPEALPGRPFGTPYRVDEALAQLYVSDFSAKKTEAKDG